MRVLSHLFERNRNWSQAMLRSDPEFFERLARQQNPEYLWIGCADSRVPANQVVQLDPGELFVHRNVANLVVHTDLNCLSVIQYAVEVLRVKHVIVCGHYGCGGVAAAMRNDALGLIDNWLRHVQDVRDKFQAELDEIQAFQDRWDRLCELNVIEQVVNVCRTTIVQNAWRNGQELSVHGWIYRLADGLMYDLKMCVTEPGDLTERYDFALNRIRDSQVA